MQSDFLDASERHWQDAEQLFESQRWANADHLFGIAAECGLKRLMLAFGMQLDQSDRPKNDKDRKHADRIWMRYETYRSGHLQGVAYGLELANPFIDWDVAQRYANQAWFDQARVEPHRMGAEKVHQLIRKAQWDGLI
ncbi:MAG: SAM-dependent methyltransferase [Pseudomonadota bacterium]